MSRTVNMRRFATFALLSCACLAARGSRNRTIEFRIRTRARLAHVGASVRRCRSHSETARTASESRRVADVSPARRVDAAPIADVPPTVRADCRRAVADGSSRDHEAVAGL